MRKTILIVSLLIIGIKSFIPQYPPTIHIREEGYTVELDRFCPNAPDDDALECQKSMLLAQGVTHVLHEGTGSEVIGNNTLEFTTCYSTKIPSFNMNLGMYCFFKGQKLEFQEMFSKMEKEQDFIDAEIKLLTFMGTVQDKPSIYQYAQDLLSMLEQMRTAFNNGELGMAAGETGTVATINSGSDEFNTARLAPPPEEPSP